MTRWKWATAVAATAVFTVVVCLPVFSSGGVANGAESQHKPSASAKKKKHPPVVVEDVPTGEVSKHASKKSPKPAPQAAAKPPKPRKPSAKKPAAKVKPAPQARPAVSGNGVSPGTLISVSPAVMEATDDTGFAGNAFPPTVSDVDYHENAWRRDDCLRCHETGVGDAPRTRHEGMPKVLFTAKCRSCHVFVRGQKPRPPAQPVDDGFASFAFPPMIPASESHKNAWTDDNCLLCHEDGIKGAPKTQHKNMPRILFTAKCRSCHVQVRAATAFSK